MKESWQDWKSRIKSKRVSFILICCILALLLLGFIRACFGYREVEGTLFYVAYDTTWYPAQLHGKDRNMIAFSNELFSAISHKTSAQFQLIPVSSSNLFPNLDKDFYDGVISLYSVNDTSKDQYLFSDNFYPLGPVLILPSHSPIHTVEDLDGKSVGIRSGASLIFNTEKQPSLLVTSYNNILSALVDLDHHAIDGVFLDAMPAYVYTTGFYLHKLHVASLPLTHDGLSVVAQDTPTGKKLIATFNEGLEAVKKDGTYEALLHKWDLFNPCKPPEEE